MYLYHQHNSFHKTLHFNLRLEPLIYSTMNRTDSLLPILTEIGGSASTQLTRGSSIPLLMTKSRSSELSPMRQRKAHIPQQDAVNDYTDRAHTCHMHSSQESHSCPMVSSQPAHNDHNPAPCLWQNDKKSQL